MGDGMGVLGFRLIEGGLEIWRARVLFVFRGGEVEGFLCKGGDTIEMEDDMICYLFELGDVGIGLIVCRVRGRGKG